LKQSTGTYLFAICYEAFFKKEHLAFCFSPPSQENEAVKRKAKAKNNSPDLQEPILNILVAAKRSRAK